MPRYWEPDGDLTRRWIRWFQSHFVVALIDDMKIRYKRIIAAVLVVVLLAGGWVFWETWKVHTAEPVMAVDYRAKLTELCRNAQPPGENAWPLLMEAISIYKTTIEEIQTRRIGARGEEHEDEGWPNFSLIIDFEDDPDDLLRERTAIEILADRSVFDLLDEAAAVPTAYQTYADVEDIFLNRNWYSSRFRGLAKINAARMRLAADAYRFSDIAAPFEQILALARFESFQVGTTSYMIGISMQAVACHELMHELRMHQFDEATCRSLLAAMDRQNRIAPIAQAFRGDRLAQRHFIQEIYTDNGNGDGYLSPAGFMRATNRHVVSPRAKENLGIVHAFKSRFSLARRADVAAAFDAAFDAVIAYAEKDGNRLAWTYDPGQIPVRAVPPWTDMLSGVAYSAAGPFKTAALYASDPAALRVMLAIEIFESRHGRPPAKLDELVPNVVADLPIDPITGGPFGYQALDHDPFGRTYVLYSFGLDGIDNGGAEYMPDGSLDRLHSPITDPTLIGHDYVINNALQLRRASPLPW